MFSHSFFFLLWWVPNGSTYWKQHTTVVDPKFNPNMPADFLQIKVQIKRTLNLWHSSQYHVCKIPYLTPLPLPLPSFGFFLLSLMVFTTRERCEMVHGFMVAYHFSNVQSYFLLLTFSIFSFKPTIFATCGRCEMIHELLSHGGISFQHWSWSLSPLFGTIIYRIYFSII